MRTGARNQTNIVSAIFDETQKRRAAFQVFLSFNEKKNKKRPKKWKFSWENLLGKQPKNVVINKMYEH